MTGRKRRVSSHISLIGTCLLVAVLVLASDPVWPKEVFMYRDQRGIVHFTDAPTDARFRPFQFTVEIKVAAASLRLNPDLLKPYILAAAQKFSLDPALITAVIRVESAFDTYAVSWAGAQGLMQLIPSTAALMNVRNVFSPRENIMGGSGYLRMMLNRFNGDLKLALAAYNCGPERVDRDKKVPDIAETQAYVQRVLEYFIEYKTKR